VSGGEGEVGAWGGRWDERGLGSPRNSRLGSLRYTLQMRRSESKRRSNQKGKARLPKQTGLSR
jgi:hypothetical protein